MKVWLPMIDSGGGADVLADLISAKLNESGEQAVRYRAPHAYTFLPWLQRRTPPPPQTDLIATHTWFGPAFHRTGIPMVGIEHLFTADKVLRPYRSLSQSIFHEKLVRKFVNYSYKNAAIIVAVSDFTHQQILKFAPGTKVQTIHNSTDLNFFTPLPARKLRNPKKPLKLLFVGNLITRKGIDLLPGIMRALGDGFQLSFTQGLRTRTMLDNVPNAKCLGKLDRKQMRSAYQDADLLLFPSRMEGLSLAIIEAAACGLPAISSKTSSMPEAIVHGESGLLCELDRIESFVEAIRELSDDPGRLNTMAGNARALAEKKFDVQIMIKRYHRLFERVLDEQTRK